MKILGGGLYARLCPEKIQIKEVAVQGRQVKPKKYL
jgi:hypothetical protein